MFATGVTSSHRARAGWQPGRADGQLVQLGVVDPPLCCELAGSRLDAIFSRARITRSISWRRSKGRPSARQRELPDRFAAWLSRGPGGAPVLDGVAAVSNAPTAAATRKRHVIFVGEVELHRREGASR